MAKIFFNVQRSEKMKYIKIIFSFLEMIIAAWKFAGGEITRGKYNREKKRISDAIARARSTDPNEGLRGNADVESFFDRYRN